MTDNENTHTLPKDFLRGAGNGIRFGITHMNDETLKRTPKLSVYWYSDMIRNNSLYPAVLSPAAEIASYV